MASEDSSYSYEKLMHETLLLGGDTDTNGAIVGGLVGAYLGLSQIP
jgi:ADP-ribosylglycohydrolase